MARWFALPALWFDRQDASNPFRSPRHRNARDLMLTIATRVNLRSLPHLGRAEVDLTVRELADAIGIGTSSVMRHLDWLQGQKLIEVIRRSPRLRLKVTNFDAYARGGGPLAPVAALPVAPPVTPPENAPEFAKINNSPLLLEKSGTRPHLRLVEKNPDISDDYSCSKNDPETKRNTDAQSGTQAEQPPPPSGDNLTMPNDSEIAKSGTEPGTAENEKRNAFYKSKKEEINNNPQTGDEPPTPSRKAPRRAFQPSAFDEQIGKHWQEVMSRFKAKVPLKNQIEGATKLREVLGYSETEIRDLLAYIEVTPFWIPNALSLSALCERRKGVSKAETIFAQMVVAKESAAAKAPPKEAPKQLTVYDLYGRL